jgi:Ni/Co efflux regulator RcnB
MIRPASAFGVLLAGMLLAGPVAQAQSDDPHAAAKDAARAAAQEWLEHLEDPDIEDSWEDAAASFRDRTDRESWARGATRLADSLGRPAARTLVTARHRDSLRAPAAPGPFVELTYRSRFPDGRYEERLLVARDEEDWRVAGYQVRPLPESTSPVRADPGS